MQSGDVQTVEWLKLAVSLVGVCGGLLTILTLVLQKTVLRERKVAKQRHEELSEQSISLKEVYGELTGQIRNLRKDLEAERQQITGLRREMMDNIGQLDSIRKAFGGYFETTRRRMDLMENRLEIVEKASDQVIRVAKGMAARIRGKADGGKGQD